MDHQGRAVDSLFAAGTGSWHGRQSAHQSLPPDQSWHQPPAPPADAFQNNAAGAPGVPGPATPAKPPRTRQTGKPRAPAPPAETQAVHSGKTRRTATGLATPVVARPGRPPPGDGLPGCLKSLDRIYPAS